MNAALEPYQCCVMVVDGYDMSSLQLMNDMPKVCNHIVPGYISE